MTDKATPLKIARNTLLACVIIIVLVPILWIVTTSLKTSYQLFTFPPKWIPFPPSLEGYIMLFSRTKILQQVLNSAVVCIGTVVVTLGFSTMAAYGFSRFRFKHKELLLIAIISLQMIPVTVNIVPLYFFAIRLRLIDTYHGLIIIFSAIRIPICIWIMKGFLDGIPVSIEEAAMIDGAPRWKVLLRILLPLTMPGLGAAAILTLVYSWSQFLLPLIINSRSSMHLATVGVYSFAVEEAVQYNLFGAAAVISSAPVVILYLFTQKMFISGLTQGSGK